MKKAVIGIVQTQYQAEKIVEQLQANGFLPSDISVLFPDRAGTSDFAIEHATKAPEGAAAGAGTGGVLGGALGLLVGIGALAIPGLGPFIAAGPLMATLGGAAVGAGVGGVTGALIGMGIPEIEAKLYEGKVKSGNILVAVHTDDSRQQKRARAIFDLADAEDVSTMSETSGSGPGHTARPATR
jgi:hypothetical protein